MTILTAKGTGKLGPKTYVCTVPPVKALKCMLTQKPVYGGLIPVITGFVTVCTTVGTVPKLCPTKGNYFYSGKVGILPPEG
jgi:hypothetical protein